MILNTKNIAKKITAIFLMPVLIYLIMLIVSAVNGNSYNIFNGETALNVLKKTSYMAIIALGIGFQLGYGRFDFSGGAITVISAMVAARLCQEFNLGISVLLIIAIVVGILMSILHSIIYIKFKVAISVISLATTFLLESFSGFIIDTTINLGVTDLAELYNSLLVLIPFALAVIACVVFQNFTIWGKQATLLARKQSVAVNIGIDEKKNTVICYIISGFIFGCAGALYAVSNYLDPITAPLSTASTLFGNIIPSLVGLFLMRFIDGTLGTFVGAFTIQLLYYGLDTNGISGGVKTICYAVFLAIFIFISGFWDMMIKSIADTLRNIKKKIFKDKNDLNNPQDGEIA